MTHAAGFTDILPVYRDENTGIPLETGNPITFTPAPDIGSFDIYHSWTILELRTNYIFIDPGAIREYVNILKEFQNKWKEIQPKLNKEDLPHTMVSMLQLSIPPLLSLTQNDTTPALLRKWASQNLNQVGEWIELIDNLRENDDSHLLLQDVQKKLDQQIFEINNQMAGVAEFLGHEINRLQDDVKDKKGGVDAHDESLLNQMKAILSDIH